jgi:hypothetical protein
MTTTPHPGNGYRREYATTVVGTPTQLANVLTNHRTAGTLIAAGRPSALAYQPGRYQIRVRLRETVPARPMVRVTSIGQYAKTRAARPRRRRRSPVPVVITAVVGVVAGLLAVAAYLIGQLVELIVAHAGLILGVLALAALLAATATRRGSGRRHCPGC